MPVIPLSYRRRTAILGVTVAALLVAPMGGSNSVAGAQAASSKLDDATIVAIFDATNTADVETGRLAVEHGQSKEVRDFGAMLARDHGMVRQLGRDVATKLKVTPTPPKPNQGAIDHAATMKKLRSLSGPAFDRAFLQHEVAFHKAALDAIGTTLMPAIQNAELKALVEKVAPAFQAHMVAAQAMLDKMAK